MPTYRVGIIGLSWITSQPASSGSHPVLGTAPPGSHAAALAAIPNVSVVAGCDIDPEARERFVETWDATWPGLATWDDAFAMLEGASLDIVTVATPDHLHGDIVQMAAASGVKGIFCEKPLSHELTDADAMIAEIERHHVPVNVNFTRRWMPPYVAAREAIRSGAIGELVQVTIGFGGPRAMLWRNHSHFLDLMTYFAESDPAWVVAELESGHEAYGTAYRGDGGRSPELEPGLNAYIAYDNGVRAFLGGMKRAVQEITVELVGTTGRIHANDRSATLFAPGENDMAATPIALRATVQGIQAALLDLIQAMETGKLVQSPPREARKTVAVIEAILQSQASGNCRVDVARP
jgi:predicted dehydrogenase